METTVSMSLGEFKTMESKAKAFDDLIKNKSKFYSVNALYRSPYWEYYIVKDPETVAKRIADELDKTRNEYQEMRDKVREYQRKINKPDVLGYWII